MTPEEKLKQLAEFAADFLGLKDSVIANWPRQFVWIDEFGTEMNIRDFFGDKFGPHLAHLAKKEWLSRHKGNQITYRFREGIHSYCLEKNFGLTPNPNTYFDMEDENEYIALWSAIMETGER